MSTLIFIISLIALLWSANHLVTGASGLAIRLQMSPFIIGLSLLAIGTTLPELFVIVVSFLKTKNTIFLSNTIGINLANISLILGITILIKPIASHYLNLKRAYPIIIIVMLFIYTLIQEGFLGKVDGCLFLLLAIMVLCIFIHLENKLPEKDIFLNSFKIAVISGRSISTNTLSIILGLLILPISVKYILQNLNLFAKLCGMSPTTISLTLAPICATLPPLITAITAAMKSEEEIAVGTILGSNLCYLLIALVFPNIINPSKVSNNVISHDLPIMLSLILLLFFLSYYYHKKPFAWHGGILLIIYFSYIFSLMVKVV